MKACKIQAGVWLRVDHLIGICEKSLTAFNTLSYGFCGFNIRHIHPEHTILKQKTEIPRGNQKKSNHWIIPNQGG
jgi:hypothetical protein